jgi:hypothetical protein
MQLALVVAALLANPVGFNTGQSITDLCGAKSPYLLGYIAGLADGLDNVKEAHPGTKAFCLPPDVTLAQLESVVCTYSDRTRPRTWESRMPPSMPRALSLQHSRAPSYAIPHTDPQAENAVAALAMAATLLSERAP